MQGSITLNELGIFIVFVLIVVAAGYAIMTLRNINSLVKEANALLQGNKDHLNRIIPNVDGITQNTAIISEDLKKSVGEAGEAIRTISHESTDTVLTIHEIAEYVARYAVVIGETVKTVVGLFSSDKKDCK